MMDKIAITQQITQDGRTYPPGAYDIIADNQHWLKGTQVFASQVVKLLANFPDVVAEFVEPPKPTLKPMAKKSVKR